MAFFIYLAHSRFYGLSYCPKKPRERDSFPEIEFIYPDRVMIYDKKKSHTAGPRISAPINHIIPCFQGRPPSPDSLVRHAVA